MNAVLVSCCIMENNGVTVIGRCEMKEGSVMLIGNSFTIDYSKHGVEKNHAELRLQNGIFTVTPKNDNYIYEYKYDNQTTQFDVLRGKYYLIGLETYFMISYSYNSSGVTGKRDLVIIENEKGDINHIYSIDDVTSIEFGSEKPCIVLDGDPFILRSHIETNKQEGHFTLKLKQLEESIFSTNLLYALWSYTPEIKEDFQNTNRIMFRAAKMIFVVDVIKSNQ